ncbi:MAG: hypothetical protein QOJ04_4485, partial [Caballeronia sp.]|nr:hypothetical protein [Caballeronia sp.]
MNVGSGLFVALGQELRNMRHE